MKIEAAKRLQQASTPKKDEAKLFSTLLKVQAVKRAGLLKRLKDA